MADAEIVERLSRAKTIPDVFDVVKASVRRVLNRERAGLMVATAEIGNFPGGFLGGYFVVASNAIIVNQTPLRRIQETEPALYVPWLYGLLLHEYLHSLGILDEGEVRRVTNHVAAEAVGEQHPAAQMAARPLDYLGNLAWPHVVWQPHEAPFEIVKGLDREATSYIQ